MGSLNSGKMATVAVAKTSLTKETAKQSVFLCIQARASSQTKDLQSRTKLLEKVFPIISTFLRNKTISKTTPLRKENAFPQFNVASHKRPGIRLSFEYTTTLLSGEGGEGRTGTATMFRKMLSKYTIFSTVLSKIVYKVIRIFSQEYLQGQNKNMLIKDTLQKQF